ncbi:MAG: hypothetical protein RI922_2583 [Bacteroidota bacterium]|jgi:hypothetical protein
MKTYKASDLFDIQISGTFPLDCEFLPKDNLPVDMFKGPGIFFLSFKGDLVYIGSFFGSKSNNNVLAQRVNKEIASISMRGKQVTFNQKALKALMNCQKFTIKNPKPKGDFVTSPLRIEFACNNWDSFQNDDFLKDFELCWLPFSNKKNKTKKELNELTNQLRSFYCPLCNGKG